MPLMDRFIVVSFAITLFLLGANIWQEWRFDELGREIAQTHEQIGVAMAAHGAARP